MAIGAAVLTVMKTAGRWGVYGFFAGVAFETGTSALEVVSDYTEKRRADRDGVMHRGVREIPLPRAA